MTLLKDELDTEKFIHDEGKILAEGIDSGWSPFEILEAASREHTLGSLAMAVVMAVRDAEDSIAAEAFRVAWNERWGVFNAPAGHVVNPATMNVR